MAITVAHIPNLECEAFYFDMERRGIALVPMEPSQVAGALERGDVDAGPVSLLDIDRLLPQTSTISGFCVASVTRAPSSVLLSKSPVDELSGRAIAVDDPDATGLQLLRVLLTQKHGVDGTTFVGREDEHEAIFLTGNQGLRGRRAVRGYPIRLDLGEDWVEWTGLPFVFSRWLVRDGMERQDFVVLEDALFVGQEDWMNNLYKSTGPRNDLLMLPREVLEYVQGMRFFMGVPEQKAIELFQEKLSVLDGAGQAPAASA